MHWFGILLTKLDGGKTHLSINLGGSLLWWSTLFHGLVYNLNLLCNLHTVIFFFLRKLSNYSLGPLIIEPSQCEDMFSGFLPDVPEPSLPVLVCSSVSLIHLSPSPTCVHGSSGLNYRDILSRWLLLKCPKGTSQAHPDFNKTGLLCYLVVNLKDTETQLCTKLWCHRWCL